MECFTLLALGLFVGGVILAWAGNGKSSIPAYMIFAALGFWVLGYIVAPYDAYSEAETAVIEAFGIPGEYVEMGASVCSASSRNGCNTWQSDYTIVTESGDVIFRGKVTSDAYSASLDDYPTDDEIRGVREELGLNEPGTPKTQLDKDPPDAGGKVEVEGNNLE